MDKNRKNGKLVVKAAFSKGMQLTSMEWSNLTKEKDRS
jgi:hypothetical protein